MTEKAGVADALDRLAERRQQENDALVKAAEFLRPQGKTGRTVDIEITPDIDEALAMLSRGQVTRLSKFLVHDLRGGGYTADGIGAMIRRYCKKVGVKSFGLMDIRAKGATDMYLAGVPLERIQIDADAARSLRYLRNFSK
jgi:hypothetical protein